MKGASLVLVLGIGFVARASAALELKLVTLAPEQLPYVYPDLRLTMENSSRKPAYFPANTFRVDVFVRERAGWLECEQMLKELPPPFRAVEWEKIEAGGVRTIPIPMTQCLCRRRSAHEVCHEWTEVPGEYQVKVTVSNTAPADSDQSDVRPGAFRGSLESAPVDIRIKQPTGADAEAVAWAHGNPMSAEILKAFPESEYAALLWYGKSRLDGADPAEIRVRIERGLFPGPNSVPDPRSPNNWSSLDSADVARWEIEWGERVLREHPSFVYRDEVRVVIALSEISLGQKEKGMQMLRDIATKQNAAAGQWSKTFLATTVSGEKK